MKGRTPPPRPLPADVDDRRIAAALKACEGISTAALKSGLVRDGLDELGQLQFMLALAAKVAHEGMNPANYLDFARAVKQAATIVARLEASGFHEHLNAAWEARTGQSLDDDAGDIVLTPLSHRTPAA